MNAREGAHQDKCPEVDALIARHAEGDHFSKLYRDD